MANENNKAIIKNETIKKIVCTEISQPFQSNHQLTKTAELEMDLLTGELKSLITNFSIVNAPGDHIEETLQTLYDFVLAVNTDVNTLSTINVKNSQIKCLNKTMINATIDVDIILYSYWGWEDTTERYNFDSRTISCGLQILPITSINDVEICSYNFTYDLIHEDILNYLEEELELTFNEYEALKVCFNINYDFDNYTYSENEDSKGTWIDKFSITSSGTTSPLLGYGTIMLTPQNYAIIDAYIKGTIQTGKNLLLPSFTAPLPKNRFKNASAQLTTANGYPGIMVTTGTSTSYVIKSCGMGLVSGNGINVAQCPIGSSNTASSNINFTAKYHIAIDISDYVK